MTTPFVYDDAMNGSVFLAYVEQILVPGMSRFMLNFQRAALPD